MSDNPAPSSTPDPNTTPVVTPQTARLTPAPIPALPPLVSTTTSPMSTTTDAPPKGIPNPWAQAKPSADTKASVEAKASVDAKASVEAKASAVIDVKQSGDPLPTGVMPRPHIGVRAERPVVQMDPQRAIETERVERAERPTPNGLPSARAGSPSTSSAATSSAATSSAVSSSADAPTSPPVVASVVPRLEDAQVTGPITKRQRAFFASPPKAEVSGNRKAPLVPLPKRPTNVRPSDQIEMSGGVVVIERTSTAWIATAAVAIAGIVIALVLGLDASSANEKLVAKEAEAADLAKRVAELETRKVVPTTAPVPAVIASDAKDANDAKVANDANDANNAQPIADALRARLPVELTRGEARIAIDGSDVRVSLDGLLDKKGRLSKKAPELLGRVGAALAPLAKNVEVVAYSDGNVGRGKSEWGQSAARATNVARALAENARTLDAKKVAVVGKGAPPKGVSGRRVEIVVSAN